MFPLLEQRNLCSRLQLSPNKDGDMETDDRLVIDSRSSSSTPIVKVSASDMEINGKYSPRSNSSSPSSTNASHWPVASQSAGAGLDAMMNKYGSSTALAEAARAAAAAGTAATPFSMGLQLLQQCVEKSLTEAQKTPSLAPLGATHELKPPVTSYQRSPLIPIDSNDILKMTSDSQEAYSCHICSTFTTENYEDFKQHVTTHFEHACDQCDYSSRTESRLKKHIQEVHSSPSPSSQPHARSSAKVFRCRQCNFVAPSKTEYWIHGRIHMRQDRMLQCPRCPFITEYKHHLEYHLRNHLGSKPFKCSKCNYACVNKSMLNSHMKSHTNVYQYRCADCSYASKYCHSLKVHLEKTSHRPASILNPDGSIPVDTMVPSPEVINRQMPIRRRRNGASATAVSYNDLAQNIPASVAFSSQLNGSLPANGAWPSRQSGEAPPPLIPIANLAASVGSSGRDYSCNYCSFSCSHYALLQQHIAVTHLAPMSLRGFPFAPPSPGSLMARQYALPMTDYSRNIVPGTGSFTPESSSPEMSPRKRSHSFIENRPSAVTFGAMQSDVTFGATQSDEDRKRSHSFVENHFARKRGFEQRFSNLQAEDEHSEDSYCRNSTPECDTKPLATASVQPEGTSEQPLDLSGGNNTKVTSEVGSAELSTNDSAASHLEEYMDVANSHLPPRKRCRKGKAYKLDMSTVVDDMPDITSSTSPKLKNHSGDLLTPPANGDMHLVPSSPTVDDLDLRSTGDANRTPPLLDKKSSITPDKSQLMSTRRVSFDAESVGAGSYRSVDSPPQPQQSVETAKLTLEGSRTGSGLHECRHCEMAFGDYFMYMMHKGYHGYQDPFTCNICGEHTNNKLDFFLHIARVAHG